MTMRESIHPLELKAAYDAGENLMALIRERSGADGNDEGAIELSYDLQSGSYAAFADTPEGRDFKVRVGQALAEVIGKLGPVTSLLEAGVGEGTTLWHTVRSLDRRPEHIHGFDLCWSRIAFARAWWARQTESPRVSLGVASLTEIPYADESFDVVFTAHAIEPNRGAEAAILSELFRVARRFVVLVEPAYETAGAEARARMDAMGYCRDLPGTAKALGIEVVSSEPFEGPSTTLNPAAVTILRKDSQAPPVVPEYACPAYRTPLDRLEDCFFSPDSMRAYPILAGIPCLRSSHAIIASKRLDPAVLAGI